MLDRGLARRGALGVGLLVLLCGSAQAAPQVCVGDCNGDQAVAINEIILGVNIALNVVATTQCPELDVNTDGRVAINELIAAVNAALIGCGDAFLSIIDPADGVLVQAGTVAAAILSNGLAEPLAGLRGVTALSDAIHAAIDRATVTASR